jgi:cysteine-rich repeat protein
MVNGTKTDVDCGGSTCPPCAEGESRNVDADGESGICNGNVCQSQSPSCGDGAVDAGEECDDGADNSDSEPGACRTDCTQPSCGDGVVDPGEECDDGNNVNGDGCSAECLSERQVDSGPVRPPF